MHAGLFAEAADLYAYERTWHNRIFAPNASCIRSEVSTSQRHDDLFSMPLCVNPSLLVHSLQSTSSNL